MSTTHRLGHDPIDDAEFEEILRRDLHIGRSILRPTGITPQD